VLRERKKKIAADVPLEGAQFMLLTNGDSQIDMRFCDKSHPSLSGVIGAQTEEELEEMILRRQTKKVGTIGEGKAERW